MNKSPFEHETCSRCGGSGQYSFNLMYGRRCFKCWGRGSVFTGRGRAAREYYNKLLTVPVSELKPGMFVYVEDMTGASWRRVISVTIDGDLSPHVETHGLDILGQKEFRIRPTDEQRQAALKAALEYQDTLTKRGKPRKVKNGKTA